MAAPINQTLSERALLVEEALKSCITIDSSHVPSLARLGEALSHAVLTGGKRLRPFLVTECAQMCGSSLEHAIPAACAIEMIHCYSLVHDDLPAMDDADLRRGKPSVHKAYDEAIAILAGDALLTDAFSVLAEADYDGATTKALVARLARAAGREGMVGGQMMDLYPISLSEDEIVGIQRRKTGAMIEAAAEMGGIVAGASEEALAALRDYASAVGLAFQIVDDLLDVTQTAEQLGKPVQADDAAGKATFVSMLGVEGAQQRVEILTAQAKRSLEQFGAGAANLEALADQLASRTH